MAQSREFLASSQDRRFSSGPIGVLGHLRTSRHNRPRRTAGTVAGGLAVVTAMSLAACEGSGGKPTPIRTPIGTRSTLPSPDLADREGTFYQQVTGPCEPTTLFPTPKQNREEAATCAASAHGNEAVVNFGLPEHEIAKITRYMRKYIREGSDGLLDPRIRIVNASPRAENALADVPLSAKGCVNLDEHPLDSPAFIAGYTMQQQLKKDDIVLAVSDQKPCDTSEAGLADTTNGRYADVFATRAGYYLDEEGKEKPLPPAIAAEVLGVDGAHETFHLHGQGHTGSFTHRNGDGFELSDSHTFDLAKFLQKGTYDEYGEPSSIMGDFNNPTLSFKRSGAATFSLYGRPKVYPWQEDVFNQPEEELTRKKNLLLERDIKQKGLTITTQQAEKGRYGIAHLQQPISLTDTVTGSEYPFETIAFVPQVSNGITYAVSVYLINFNNPDVGVPQTTSVNIGMLWPSNGVLRLRYKNQQFIVGINQDSVDIHSHVRK